MVNAHLAPTAWWKVSGQDTVLYGMLAADLPGGREGSKVAGKAARLEFWGLGAEKNVKRQFVSRRHRHEGL